MINWNGLRRALVVAPHPDDECLGAGGAIAKLTTAGVAVTVLTVAGHRPPLYSDEDYETTLKEAREAHRILGVRESVFLHRRATFLDKANTAERNKEVHDVVAAVEPQLVLCAFPDRHIDHRIVFEAVQVAARPVGVGRCIEVLAVYETLSETYWNAPHIEPNFVPNWVVDISDFVDAKLSALMCYKSQIPAFPGARSLDAVRALGVLRGTQSGFPHGEAFQIVRMVS